MHDKLLPVVWPLEHLHKSSACAVSLLSREERLSMFNEYMARFAALRELAMRTRAAALPTVIEFGTEDLNMRRFNNQIDKYVSELFFWNPNSAKDKERLELKFTQPKERRTHAEDLPRFTFISSLDIEASLDIEDNKDD